MTCIDNMDSPIVSALIIIQESSDAAAKDLDRPMCSGPESSGPVNGMGIRLFGCRGPEHEERIRARMGSQGLETTVGWMQVRLC